MRHVKNISKKKFINSVKEKPKEKQGLHWKWIAIVFSVALLVFAVFCLILSNFYFSQNLNNTLKSNIKEDQLSKKESSKNYSFELTQFSKKFNGKYATISVPAIDKEGNGVLTKLYVEIVNGSGRTLVDIDNLLFWEDTQQSIRVAKKVAQNVTGISLDKYDIIYGVEADATIIGGESAGAALTIVTIAALENKTIKKDVMITGTINHDGTIGPVESILPKAKVAQAYGINTFLVPLLHSREIIYEVRKHCEKYGTMEFCTEERIPKKVNVSEEAKLDVREVGTIQEALAFFFE